MTKEELRITAMSMAVELAKISSMVDTAAVIASAKAIEAFVNGAEIPITNADSD